MQLCDLLVNFETGCKVENVWTCAGQGYQLYQTKDIKNGAAREQKRGAITEKAYGCREGEGWCDRQYKGKGEMGKDER